MCKGAIVRRLKARNVYGRVIYCGDGLNDFCAALALSSEDLLMAKSNSALHSLVIQNSCSSSAKDPNPTASVKATVRIWKDHEVLLESVLSEVGDKKGGEESASVDDL